jgi:hypothetical protein
MDIIEKLKNKYKLWKNITYVILFLNIVTMISLTQYSEFLKENIISNMYDITGIFIFSILVSIPLALIFIGMMVSERSAKFKISYMRLEGLTEDQISYRLGFDSSTVENMRYCSL